jgi:hypothetical protein
MRVGLGIGWTKDRPKKGPEGLYPWGLSQYWLKARFKLKTSKFHLHLARRIPVALI